MHLGILGGTFNPIHLGHLVLAESARQQCALDQVWFMPTARPPHKSSRGVLSGPVRLHMVRLAVKGHPAFEASDLELRLGGISYTVNTVRALRAKHPRAELFLIVGADMLSVSWRGMEELAREGTFAAAGRQSSSGDHSAAPAGHTVLDTARVRPISMPRLDVSSSMIRERVRQRLSIRYLVPDAVARYISRHRLYRGRGA